MPDSHKLLTAPHTAFRDGIIARVGTWGSGPLDNDTAADWCGDLNDTPPAERPARIRRTLTLVADHGPADYLDRGVADEAVAAALVVASQLPGGPPPTSSYAPEFLREGGTITVEGDWAGLALRALDRVDGENSETRELWEDDYARVLDQRRPVRETLERAAPA